MVRLEIAWLTLRQAATKFATGSLDDSVEQRVLQIQKQSKDWPKYAQALCVLADGMEADGSDFLGQCFHELALNDKTWKGQCFTPTAVCTAMAQMSLMDAEPKDGYTMWLAEPACGGGGAMVLAASAELKSRGFYPWHYHWQCIDIDWRCAAMTYIQTTLLGIPAVVVHGNALTLEVRESHRNIISLMHPPKPRKDSSGVEVADPEASEASCSEASCSEASCSEAGVDVQLELF